MNLQVLAVRLIVRTANVAFADPAAFHDRISTVYVGIQRLIFLFLDVVSCVAKRNVRNGASTK